VLSRNFYVVVFHKVLYSHNLGMVKNLNGVVLKDNKGRILL